jgi:selenocysteine lyase/cysteine desulfurase
MICVDMRSLVNYLERHGLDASLDIIERTGVDIIERHVLWFTDLLIRKLQERG